MPGIPSSPWFVYILRCRDGSLYTGITNDLDKRLKAHAAGKASRYTRSRLPVALAYSEPQKSKSVALKGDPQQMHPSLLGTHIPLVPERPPVSR